MTRCLGTVTVRCHPTNILETVARPDSPAAAPILVADDDAKIVQLVRTYLEREGFSVVGAHDGREALAAVRERRPRLVVLDLMLPELDGLAVMRAVREDWPVPILILSARGSTADRVLGISEGADDYLPKPFSPTELVVRVKAILRRTEIASAQKGTLLFRDVVVDLDRQEVRRAGALVALTGAEFKLLAALVRAEGRILSREALLDALYGEAEAGVLDRTVDVYIRRLRDKLGDQSDRPRYISTVRGAGYRTPPDDA